MSQTDGHCPVTIPSQPAVNSTSTTFGLSDVLRGPQNIAIAIAIAIDGWSLAKDDDDDDDDVDVDGAPLMLMLRTRNSSIMDLLSLRLMG